MKNQVFGNKSNSEKFEKFYECLKYISNGYNNFKIT